MSQLDKMIANQEKIVKGLGNLDHLGGILQLQLVQCVVLVISLVYWLARG